MAKTVRKILSPAAVKVVDGILRSRHESKEQLREERSRNDKLLAPDGDADVTKADVQAGRRMTRQDFMRRLMKLNPDLRYQQSKNYPKQGGVYMVGYRRDNLTGVTEYGEWFVCGMPHDVLNEFSVPVTAPSIIPSTAGPAWDSLQRVEGMVRGWRAVLLKLLQDGLLTPTQIDKEFQISKGRSSQKWQQALN